ncbi:unnamed protein product [Cyclocybe aegerita]|uniref:Uncharacterized protein n=1 Tax=Cyclocybe aegerita TaxID=1973307 RepID=A0A8S0W5X2_CYCAE|nr:unnamed protein product [Cyclocybe aegerita]
MATAVALGSLPAHELEPSENWDDDFEFDGGGGSTGGGGSSRRRRGNGTAHASGGGGGGAGEGGMERNGNGHAASASVSTSASFAASFALSASTEDGRKMSVASSAMLEDWDADDAHGHGHQTAKPALHPPHHQRQGSQSSTHSNSNTHLPPHLHLHLAPPAETENWDDDFEERHSPRKTRHDSQHEPGGDSDDSGELEREFGLKGAGREDEEDRTVTAKSRRAAVARLSSTREANQVPPVPTSTQQHQHHPLPLSFLPQPSTSSTSTHYPNATHPYHHQLNTISPPPEPYPHSPTASVFSVPTSSYSHAHSFSPSPTPYPFSSTTHLRPSSAFALLPPSPPIHKERERRRLRKKSRPAPGPREGMFELASLASSRERLGAGRYSFSDDGQQDGAGAGAGIEHTRRATTTSRSQTPGSELELSSADGHGHDQQKKPLPIPATPTKGAALLSRIGSVKNWGRGMRRRGGSTAPEVVANDQDQETQRTPRPRSSMSSIPASSHPSSSRARSPPESTQPTASSSNWFFRSSTSASGGGRDGARPGGGARGGSSAASGHGSATGSANNTSTNLARAGSTTSRGGRGRFSVGGGGFVAQPHTNVNVNTSKNLSTSDLSINPGRSTSSLRIRGYTPSPDLPSLSGHGMRPASTFVPNTPSKGNKLAKRKSLGFVQLRRGFLGGGGGGNGQGGGGGGSGNGTAESGADGDGEESARNSGRDSGSRGRYGGLGLGRAAAAGVEGKGEREREESRSRRKSFSRLFRSYSRAREEQERASSSNADLQRQEEEDGAKEGTDGEEEQEKDEVDELSRSTRSNRAKNQSQGQEKEGAEGKRGFMGSVRRLSLVSSHHHHSTAHASSHLSHSQTHGLAQEPPQALAQTHKRTKSGGIPGLQLVFPSFGSSVSGANSNAGANANANPNPNVGEKNQQTPSRTSKEKVRMGRVSNVPAPTPGLPHSQSQQQPAALPYSLPPLPPTSSQLSLRLPSSSSTYDSPDPLDVPSLPTRLGAPFSPSLGSKPPGTHLNANVSHNINVSNNSTNTNRIVSAASSSGTGTSVGPASTVHTAPSSAGPSRNPSWSRRVASGASGVGSVGQGEERTPGTRKLRRKSTSGRSNRSGSGRSEKSVGGRSEKSGRRSLDSASANAHGKVGGRRGPSLDLDFDFEGELRKSVDAERKRESSSSGAGRTRRDGMQAGNATMPTTATTAPTMIAAGGTIPKTPSKPPPPLLPPIELQPPSPPRNANESSHPTSSSSSSHHTHLDTLGLGLSLSPRSPSGSVSGSSVFVTPTNSPRSPPLSSTSPNVNLSTNLGVASAAAGVAKKLTLAPSNRSPQQSASLGRTGAAGVLSSSAGVGEGGSGCVGGGGGKGGGVDGPNGGVGKDKGARRNSLGDLKIPARISQAQVGLRRDLGMVREFAGSVGQIKELQQAYCTLASEIQSMLDTQAHHLHQQQQQRQPPSTPAPAPPPASKDYAKTTSPGFFSALHIGRPKTRGRSNTNGSLPPKDEQQQPKERGDEPSKEHLAYKEMASAFWSINSKYRITWECADLLIELGGAGSGGESGASTSASAAGPSTSTSAPVVAALDPMGTKRSRERAITLAGDESKPLHAAPGTLGPSNSLPGSAFHPPSASDPSTSSSPTHTHPHPHPQTQTHPHSPPLASPPTNSWRASTGRHDLSQRQLVLLREMLNNGSATVSVSAEEMMQMQLERAIPEESLSTTMTTAAVNREWRWGGQDPRNSTITLPSEESAGVYGRHEKEREEGEGEGEGRRSSMEKKRRGGRLGMSGIRDMLRALKRSHAESGTPALPVPGSLPMPMHSTTSLSTESSMGHHRYAHPRIPSHQQQQHPQQRRRAKTSTDPESMRERDREREREMRAPSPYGYAPSSYTAPKPSPRRPSLASIFRLGGTKNRPTSTFIDDPPAPISSSLPSSTSSSMPPRSDHPSAEDSSSTGEEDWDRMDSASDLDAAARALGIGVATDGSAHATVRGGSRRKGRSPYLQHDSFDPPPPLPLLTPSGSSSLPSPPNSASATTRHSHSLVQKRSFSASQSSLNHPQQQVQQQQPSPNPPPPRTTRLSNVEEQADTGSPHGATSPVSVTSTSTSRAAKSQARLSRTGASPSRPSSRPSSSKGTAPTHPHANAKTGSVRSMPPHLTASMSMSAPLPDPKLAMTPENIRPLLENAREVQAKILECLAELRGLVDVYGGGIGGGGVVGVGMGMGMNGDAER